MKESDFQKELKKEILNRFPGCYVLKNDPRYCQGFPDLTVLYGDKWAALEVKRSANASHRPNQDIRVEELNKMSYSAFIYPENKEEILDEVAKLFRT